jgi:modification methylase
MFSVREDTVLDPFLGTGTTTMAAMATARNSIGFEIDANFGEHIFSRFNGIVDFSNRLIEDRIANHLNFVRERIKLKGGLGYVSKVYGFPVMTSQETEITFDEPKKLTKKESEAEVEYKEEPTFKLIEGTLFQKGKSLKNWIKQD